MKKPNITMEKTIKINDLKKALIDIYKKNRGIDNLIFLNEIWFNICNSLNIEYNKLSDEVFK